MSKKQLITLIIIFICLGVAFALIYVRFNRMSKPTAGLRVESTPPSVVYVNNVQEGRTPFEKVFPPGEVTVRLIPESSGSAIPNYQTKVRLVNKVYTIIRREFSENDSQTAGEIITLSPINSLQSSLSVLTSEPESALVSVDGLSQGFSPISLTSLAASQHQIEVSAPGFVTRTIQAKTVNGYQLSANVKLAAKTGFVDSPVFPTPTSVPVSATPSSFPKPYVIIKSTPTGFLRVRLEANKNSKEIAQVQPNEKFSFLDESESGAWYLIKLSLPSTQSGWVSSEYAEVYK